MANKFHDLLKLAMKLKCYDIVHVYSPDIPESSAYFMQVTPWYWHSHCHGLIFLERMQRKLMQLKPFIQFRFFVPPGTTYCWMARGNVDSKLAQGLLYVTSVRGIGTPDLSVSRSNNITQPRTLQVMQSLVKRL